MSDMIRKVNDTNRDRDMAIFARRMLKLGEEYGEASQAYLSVSSESNGKKKKWDDVREELVDVLVVTLDLLCHALPGEEALTFEELETKITSTMDRKLDKWTKKMKKKDDISR